MYLLTPSRSIKFRIQFTSFCKHNFLSISAFSMSELWLTKDAIDIGFPFSNWSWQLRGTFFSNPNCNALTWFYTLAACNVITILYFTVTFWLAVMLIGWISAGYFAFISSISFGTFWPRHGYKRGGR